MILFEPRRMPLALLAGALFTCSAIPAAASTISSTVGTPLANTGTAGQLVTTGAGANFAEALTGYGLNKVYATSGNSTLMSAGSDWIVDFTLTEAGNTGGFIPLSVTYSYDANLTLAGTNNSTANFVFNLSNGQGSFNGFAGNRASTLGAGFQDQCPSRFPQGGDHPPGACAGSYSSGGPVTVLVTNVFTVGANKLEGVLGANASIGTADAFSTGKIISVTVPSDVSWSYTDLTGNPLNFQNAPSGVPEPGTWGCMAVGLAVLLFRRMRNA
jgi:hypothetical protein